MAKIKGKILTSEKGHEYKEISLLSSPGWIKKIIWENVIPDKVIGSVMYFKGKKYRYCVYFENNFETIEETGWLEGVPLMRGLKVFRRKRGKT
ncbi:MAG: hypothetical protein J4472_02050 [DPANN group archaeon]|nr:hypothetical protein [DPANN group archaeon]